MTNPGLYLSVLSLHISVLCFLLGHFSVLALYLLIPGQEG
jgi:hypothetical protein